jgi:hypothetical protein
MLVGNNGKPSLVMIVVFSRISKEVAEERREFSLGFTSLADSSAIGEGRSLHSTCVRSTHLRKSPSKFYSKIYILDWPSFSFHIGYNHSNVSKY